MTAINSWKFTKLLNKKLSTASSLEQVVPLKVRIMFGSRRKKSRVLVYQSHFKFDELYFFLDLETIEGWTSGRYERLPRPLPLDEIRFAIILDSGESHLYELDPHVLSLKLPLNPALRGK